MSDLAVERLEEFGFDVVQLKALIDQFLAGLIPDFESLEREIQERNWEQAKSLTHSFKGMLSLFVTTQFVGEFQDLENELKFLIKNKDLCIQTDLSQLKHRLKQLHFAARAYQEQL